MDPRTKRAVPVLNEDFECPDVSDRLLKLQCSRLSNLLSKLSSSKQLLPSDVCRFGPPHPYSGVIPRFYGLPKLHKLGPLKIRPIISNHGLYCGPLMLHLKNILNLVIDFDTSVRHSYEFSSLLDESEFRYSDLLVSFDVTSLFTKVPVRETLEILERRLIDLQARNPDILLEVTNFSIKAIMELLNFVLTDCFFIYGGHLYRQCEGLPMGGRLSPILAGIFMEDLEARAMATSLVVPHLFKRYVDDIFLIWDRSLGHYTSFLDCLNQQHPNIQLTVEEEMNGSLPFLDVLVTRPGLSGTSKRPYSLAIFRKPTHANRYLHYKSAHPYVLKRSTLRGLWLRARRILKNHPKQFQSEINHLRRTFSHDTNGYPISVINKWLASFEKEQLRKPNLLTVPIKSSREV